MPTAPGTPHAPRPYQGSGASGWKKTATTTANRCRRFSIKSRVQTQGLVQALPLSFSIPIAGQDGDLWYVRVVSWRRGDDGALVRQEAIYGLSGGAAVPMTEDDLTRAIASERPGRPEAPE